MKTVLNGFAVEIKKEAMNTYTDHIKKLTRQYNDAIRALQDAYDMEQSQSYEGLFSSSRLKRQYSNRYEALESEYRSKCRQLFNEYKATHPEWARWRHLWGRVFIIGIIAMTTCCGAAVVADDANSTSGLYESSESGIRSSAAETYWNADNIPIPYLQDSTQYVSNPDSVLTPSAVQRMNITLQRLRLELGVQSVFIVVNHIENDDPFRMAQDVGNKYGVGYNNRGLVVVVGYEDHSINMSPGRALEADLTDAECHRLEQQYVVPAMRAEMPDSGMIYLAEATYALLQKKELPQMSALTGSTDESDNIETTIGLSFLFIIAWTILFLRLNKKYQWIGLLGTALLPNPFYVSERSHISGGGGFGGFSGGGGGGGFSGGSFGGGSFGGGGATSRW